MDAEATCLFEATFSHDHRRARVDVLWKRDQGWVLDEVKMSTVKPPDKIKPDKLWDLGFQYVLLRDVGLEIEAARLLLVDSSYVWEGGPYDPHAMLGPVDLTERCQELEPEIRQAGTRIFEALAQPEEPEAELNTHCKDCDYFDHCFQDRPRNDVIYLPKVTARRVRELRQAGYDRIEQIPDEERLTSAQRRLRDALVSGVPSIGEGLAEQLQRVEFPAAFVDYESSSSAFPVYPGTRPYRQICFQWSAHLLDSCDGPAEHREFLPEDGRDPREEFCRTLWQTVSASRSLVHYHNFEITQLKPMVDEGIPYAKELLDAFLERSVDLEKIVREHVCLAEFMGRSSIKVVLPALVPELSYKGVAIASGTEASTAYRRMIAPTTPPEEAQTIREALLEYCKLDTWAMIAVYRALLRLTDTPPQVDRTR